MTKCKKLSLCLLTGCPALQQLYMYGGLLIVYASLNAFPLKTVVKLARIGAWWLVAGSVTHCMPTIPLLYVGSHLHGCIAVPFAWLVAATRRAETSYAGGLMIVLTLLMVTKKRQKWSWVLADFKVTLL